MSQETVAEPLILISMPQLQDPYFVHSTSLITEFNQDGAMGLILNRPMKVNLSEIMGEPIPREKEKAISIYWGGPVQNDRGWIVHEDEDLKEESVVLESGLYVSSSENVLRKMIETSNQNSPKRYRFYLGYSGWGPGQLEQEMAAGSWLTAPLDRSFIYDDTTIDSWNRALASIGVDPVTLSSSPQTDAN